MNTNSNKNTRINSDQQLMNGALKHLGKSTVVIDGRTYTPKEVVARLQERMDATAEVVASKATWQAKVRAEHDKLEETKKFVACFRQAVLAMFASSQDTLADFGLTARRAPRELTAVEKVARVARASSTRAARHTMGPREKAKVKGDTDVNVVVTTGASAASSGQGAQPAPTPPSPSLPAPVPPAPAPVPPVPAPVPVPPVLPPPATSASSSANGAGNALNGAASA